MTDIILSIYRCPLLVLLSVDRDGLGYCQLEYTHSVPASHFASADGGRRCGKFLVFLVFRVAPD